MSQPSAGGIHPAAVAGRVQKPRRRKAVKVSTEVKNRVAITPEGTTAVIDSKPGPLTLFDRVKSYYHTLIILLAALLVLLNEVAPFAHWIPGYGAQLAGFVSVAIVLVGAVVTFLKSNEHWVQSL